MSKVLSSALLLGLLSLSTSTQMTTERVSCAEVNNSQNNFYDTSIAYPTLSAISFNIDDVLTSFKINDQELFPAKMPEHEKKDFDFTKTIYFPIRPGMKISMTGVNIGGPAGMLATIRYRNPQGNIIYYNTNGSWRCGCPGGLQQAVAYNSNIEGTHGAVYNKIAADAWWIWTRDNVVGTPVTCEFTIPQ